MKQPVVKFRPKPEDIVPIDNKTDNRLYLIRGNLAYLRGNEAASYADNIPKAWVIV